MANWWIYTFTWEKESVSLFHELFETIIKQITHLHIKIKSVCPFFLENLIDQWTINGQLVDLHIYMEKGVCPYFMNFLKPSMAQWPSYNGCL